MQFMWLENPQYNWNVSCVMYFSRSWFARGAPFNLLSADCYWI